MVGFTLIRTVLVLCMAEYIKSTLWRILHGSRHGGIDAVILIKPDTPFWSRDSVLYGVLIDQPANMPSDHDG